MIDEQLDPNTLAPEDEQSVVSDGEPGFDVDTSRPCQRPGCANYLPLGAIRTQKYCPEHQPKKKKNNLGAATGPAPKSVTVNFPRTPSNKADSDAAKVEEGAKAMLGLVATGLSLVDEVCAGAILESIPAIARQLGELSKFQPVLKKIFTPGESTGEALAWIGLVIALSPVTLAILAHHNLLKPDTLERLAGFVNVGKASLDVEPAA